MHSLLCPGFGLPSRTSPVTSSLLEDSNPVGHLPLLPSPTPCHQHRAEPPPLAQQLLPFPWLFLSLDWWAGSAAVLAARFPLAAGAPPLPLIRSMAGVLGEEKTSLPMHWLWLQVREVWEFLLQWDGRKGGQQHRQTVEVLLAGCCCRAACAS